MSLLPVQAYANLSTPLWASADISGGAGPTGPTGPAGTGATGPTGPAGAGGSFVTQIFQYEVPSGSNGGTAPGTGTFYARPFNTGYPALDPSGNSTVIAGLSLDTPSTSTIFTFPAGTFAISGELGGLMTVEKARLYDSAGSNVLASRHIGWRRQSHELFVLLHDPDLRSTDNGGSTVRRVQFSRHAGLGSGNWLRRQ